MGLFGNKVGRFQPPRGTNLEPPSPMKFDGEGSLSFVVNNGVANIHKKSKYTRLLVMVWDTTAIVLSLYLAIGVVWQICMCTPAYGFTADYAAFVVADYAVDLFFWADLVTRVLRLFRVVEKVPEPEDDESRISIRRDSWKQAGSFIGAGSFIPSGGGTGSFEGAGGLSTFGGSLLSTTGSMLEAATRKEKRACCTGKCRELLKFDIVVSFLSCLPIELIGLAAGTPIAPWRINRVARLLLFHGYWRSVEDYLDYKGLLPSPSVTRIPRLFIFMAIFAHWCGSLFYLLAYQEAMGGAVDTWASNDGLWTVSHVNASDPTSPTKLTFIQATEGRYVRALYW